MSNIQTIDGVSRRMLTALLCHVSELENRALVDELRALLAKPAECEMCGGSGRLGMGFCPCGEQKPAAQHQSAMLTFNYQHPFTSELHSVSLSKAEVADGMEDTLYEKLVAQFCQCESVGETNVVDCNCDEYIHDFDLVADDAKAAQHQGEPVAWVVISPDGKELSELQSNCDHALDLAHDMDGELPAHHEGGKHDVRAVYFAAPVAVVLPERQSLRDSFENGGVAQEQFSQGWNACLDEVTRLNTK